MSHTTSLYTSASTDNAALITATLLPDAQRLHFWPQHFGGIPQWILLEPHIFGWMDRLCENYSGGIWRFYTLTNGGAFMAPEPDDENDGQWTLFNTHEWQLRRNELHGGWYRGLSAGIQPSCLLYEM